MSVIKVTLPPGQIPVEGKQVSFKAPCPCTVTEAIQIEDENYIVCDSLGKCVTGAGGVWDVGSIVTVTLSVEQKKAYIQNTASAVLLTGTPEATPITGNLYMEKSSPLVRLKNTDNGSALALRQYLKQSWLGNYPVAGDNNNYRALILNGSGGSYPTLLDLLWIAEKKDGGTTQYYNVAHTGNFPDLGVAQIAAGTYKGTGTYGKDIPNILNFSFVPKVILFFGKMRTANNNADALPLVMLCDAGVYQLAGSIYGMTVGNVSVSGTTVSWYTTKSDIAAEDKAYAPYGQMNGDGETYYYVAFG